MTEQPAEDARHAATALDPAWTEGPGPAGGLLRFGPGVPRRPPGRGARRRRAVRRYGPAAVVLVALVVVLLWRCAGPPLAVTGVSVSTAPAGPGCGGTAEVLGVVRTNGRPGTLTYQWVRGGGDTIGPLTERLPAGRDETRLRLLWTVRGEGTFTATAELRVTGPSRHTGSARFTYRCP